MEISVNITDANIKQKFLKNKNIDTRLRDAHDRLHALDRSSGTGWVELASMITEEEINAIKQAAEKIKEQSKILVVIGIGGSYAGIKAGLDALGGNKENCPEIMFMGTTFSASELTNCLTAVKENDASVCVISKSGTTTESLVAFNLIENYFKKKYKKGAEYKNRIYVITDYEKGYLREVATREGYASFIIPRTVGGRYSVLSPVGLLPLCTAGINIEEILEGAKETYKNCFMLNDQNPAYLYALARNILHTKYNKMIEVLTSFDDRLVGFYEWYKQLFAESEGKDGKGLFVSSLTYSTDLHSFGQFLQQGSPVLFETFLDIMKPEKDIKLENIDVSSPIAGLEGVNLSDVIGATKKGVLDAHKKAGVPIINIKIDELNERAFGALVQFFELSCAVSGYLLGVNPFDQPGVEEYKKNTRENFNSFVKQN